MAVEADKGIGPAHQLIKQRTMPQIFPCAYGNATDCPSNPDVLSEKKTSFREASERVSMKAVNPTKVLLFLISSETGVVENCRKSDGAILETDFTLQLRRG